MNQKAAELGCVNTHFVNPNGLPAENHYSSAYDLYLITSAAMKYPLFMEIANTLSYQFNDPNINNGYPIQNSNALINVNASHSRGGRYLYEGASGVKTGYTNAAGYCLISTAQRDGINVLAIAMGCLGELNGDAEDFWNFKDSITMYDWVFDNFSHRSILSTSENITSVTVELSDGDSIMLHPQKGITALLPDDVAVEDIQRSITVYEDKLVAPIAAGTPLGHLTLSLDGEELGSVELVNSSEVALSKLEYMKQRIAEVFSNGWVIALVVLVLVFLFVYLALVVRYRRLRQQHLRQRRRMEQRRRLEQERMYAESRQHREPSQVDPSQRYNDPFDLDHFFDDER